MKIRNRLNPSDPCFSFEFFPPKTDQGVKDLLGVIQDLAELKPGFVSVTYGAGGSTRDRTLDLVAHVKRQTQVDAMAHLTCVGHTQAELSGVLDRLAKEKIENVLVLRGDPPQGSRPSPPPPGAFATRRNSSPSSTKKTTASAWAARVTRKGTSRRRRATKT